MSAKNRETTRRVVLAGLAAAPVAGLPAVARAGRRDRILIRASPGATNCAERRMGGQHNLKRIGARPRAKLRQTQAHELEEKWRAKKAERWKEMQALYRKKVKRFDIYGKPLESGAPPEKDVSGHDVCLGLERAYTATGDPLFADAISALQAYGLHQGKPRKSYSDARIECWGDDGHRLLESMRWLIDNPRLIDNRRYSIRAAAERVAAENPSLEHNTFDAQVGELRARYSTWKRSGFALQPNRDRGNVGYCVHVRPALGRRVHFPASREVLPDEGAIVPFTAYWRRRFADGDVEIFRPSKLA